MDVEEEDSTLVWRLRRAEYCCLESDDEMRGLTHTTNPTTSPYLPVEGIITHRTGRTLGWRVIADVLQLLVYPFKSHHVFLSFG